MNTVDSLNETFDVVVVGAGPVGLMLACELRTAGVNVLVVERLREIDRSIKAGAINVPTAQAFARRAMLPQLREYQAAILARMAGMFTAGKGSGRPPFAGHFAGIMLDAALVDFDDPAFAEVGPAGEAIFVPQWDIEEMLGRRAIDSGVVIRRGVAVTDFDDDGAGVTVEFGDTTVRAGWLVGCDGGRSTVRKLAGFDFPGLDPEVAARQAIVEMTGAEELRRGWTSTPTGIYVNGPIPGRILTVELDGPPIDRETPVTAAELEDALERVSGIRVQITAVHSATRFTDNTRQVPEYRKGRVLVAGDAAHVHSPFGGQGLNLGVGDAVNLGWKLAAVIAGRSPVELLDTYTSERHPIGAWVLDWTRAQIALMRLDQRSTALRAVVSDLLATRDGANYIFQKIAGVLHRYDFGGTHDLTGRAAPDVELADGTRLGDHCHDGRPVLLDLGDSPDLRAIAARWNDRVHLVTAKTAQPRDLSALLMRPDGYVAWAADNGDLDGLPEALTRWFGSES